MTLAEFKRSHSSVDDEQVTRKALVVRSMRLIASAAEVAPGKK